MTHRTSPSRHASAALGITLLALGACAPPAADVSGDLTRLTDAVSVLTAQTDALHSKIDELEAKVSTQDAIRVITVSEPTVVESTRTAPAGTADPEPPPVPAFDPTELQRRVSSLERQLGDAKLELQLAKGDNEANRKKIDELSTALVSAEADLDIHRLRKELGERACGLGQDRCQATMARIITTLEDDIRKRCGQHGRKGVIHEPGAADDSWVLLDNGWSLSCST